MSKAEQADKMIDRYVLWSMGAGAIPIPMLDMAVVTGLQFNMCKDLCALYGVDFNESMTKNIITSLAGATLAKVGASLIKAIPVVGSMLGGVPMVVLSGTSTYSIGHVFKKHLEIGDIFSTFKFDNAKKMYDNIFDQGKGYVNNLYETFIGGKQNPENTESQDKTKEESKADSQAKEAYESTDDVFEKLRILGELKEKGVLTEQEFQTKKTELLKQI